jgi:hypothetical protein
VKPLPEPVVALVRDHEVERWKTLGFQTMRDWLLWRLRVLDIPVFETAKGIDVLRGRLTVARDSDGEGSMTRYTWIAG